MANLWTIRQAGCVRGCPQGSAHAPLRPSALQVLKNMNKSEYGAFWGDLKAFALIAYGRYARNGDQSKWPKI